MNRDEITRIFREPPVLSAERIFLRKMRKTDSYDMFEYSKRQDVTKYLLWEPHRDESYTYKYLTYVQSRYRSGDFFDWSVIYRENNKMIGTCGFTRINTDSNSAEIGYVLNPDYWGRGIAAEAVRRVMRFGFDELSLHRIEAKYMIDNIQSRRVMEKVGMTYEGVNRDSMFVRGNYVSVGVCAILSSEFDKIKYDL